GWGLICDIVIADIDGDNMQETIVANSGSMIHIYEHDGDGMVLAYNLTHPSWGDGTQVNTIAVGDLDNDGSPYLEVLATTYSHAFHSVVFKKIGDLYSPVFNISSADPRHACGNVCTVGDMDNNGDLEFIVTEQISGSDGLSLLRLFDWQTNTWVNIRNYAFVTGDYNNNVQQVQIADVDNDNENEVLVNSDQEFVHTLEYVGGVFVKSWSCALLDDRINCAIAGDITNDGLIDIVVPDSVTDLIYIYETVTGSIVNTFNISFVHDNNWGGPGYTCMDIGDLDDDAQNEWVFVHWNETVLPHEWITIFRNDTVLQEGPTGYLYASTVEIGNYDNDLAGTVVTTTNSTTTSTTNTTETDSIPIPFEILTLAIALPISLIVIAIVVKRRRS
ncbi:MAG: VCBS repeat-containing protein, partial [Candidatus Thorarchaeota archaeon]|nr:VCBS repeat-containing protein [Candidatus Thorarchaeota archaeon]